ncbi:site-2 protease family protein [Emticicia sp. 21SJ11W-3]|uniref:site-2 protease family protein n=1 Tax=Emticicia sp. 21SJ11W-3 TaxID=2916755 RepID=UPI00209CF7E7|nr:site-2 protease family protein [Emticicia sp. 21SJ11W-3]UTA69860.1 site-2 protease family protein [Emticicia sp. 21SJ11W-3]
MKQNRTLLIQLALFIVTIITTTLTGAEWIFGNSFFFSSKPMGWEEFLTGFQYSIPFLGVLTVHEFGHYFVAKKHKTDVTLPYYIPLWLGGLSSTFGTMGAFIRIKERINSRVKYFDIGIAGPLAGFVAALVVLWYGFSHLPSLDYVFELFPVLKQYGMEYGHFLETSPDYFSVKLGDSLLFSFFENYVAVGDLPHPYLYTNYPIIFAGYLSLFFTALNLFPIGQLDGGHILYGLIGDKAFNIVSPILFTGFVFYAGLGTFNAHEFQTVDSEAFLDLLWKFVLYIVFNYLCFSRISEKLVTNWLITLSVIAIQLIITYFYPTVEGYSGFLAFGLMIGRFLGIYHPRTYDNQPLTPGRKILGWIALLIFILCFTPKPFTIIQNV